MGDPKQSLEDSDVGANLALVEESASTVRRMVADESYGADGVRTIWHRGRRIDLISFENNKEEVLRQELTFFGFVVEFRKTQGLRTGTVPIEGQGTEGGHMATHTFKFDAVLKHRTLDFASLLLKNIPGRDFYAQHLLKHVNMALTVQGFDNLRTEVSKLSSFGKAATPRQARPTEKLNPISRVPTWAIALGLIVAGVAVGALLVSLLLSR
jgi:hypothetical protein